MIRIFGGSRSSKFVGKEGKKADFRDSDSGDKIVCRYPIWDEIDLD
jgi:hypothetical protein